METCCDKFDVIRGGYTTPPLHFGSSRTFPRTGPLVDHTGTVIGVNALIRPDLRALGNYAVSSLEVCSFLQSIRPAKNAASSLSQEFKVWLYNDRMNKRARVAAILNQTASLDATMANQVMMAAHTTGRGMVGKYTTEDEARTIYNSLRQQDLLVEIESS